VQFSQIQKPVTLILTLDRVKVTLVRIPGRDISTHQIRSKSEKLFLWTYGLTDGRTHLSSVSLLTDRLAMT